MLIMCTLFACGTEVQPATDTDSGIGHDAADSGSQANADTPLVGDDRLSDSAVEWQQPELRMIVRVSPAVALEHVGLAAKPRVAFVRDGAHGFERVVDGCTVRRRIGWALRDIGPLTLQFVGHIDSTMFDQDLGYSLVIPDVAIPIGAPIQVSGGAGTIGEFSLRAKKPPRASAIFPAGNSTMEVGRLPIDQSLVLRWEPVESEYPMSVIVGGDELSGASVVVWCRTPANTGRFAFTPLVLDVLRQVTRGVVLEMGLSDESRTVVGGVSVVLTSSNPIVYTQLR